jgi:hypothetical protein
VAVKVGMNGVRADIFLGGAEYFSADLVYGIVYFNHDVIYVVFFERQELHHDSFFPYASAR